MWKVWAPSWRQRDGGGADGRMSLTFTLRLQGRETVVVTNPRPAAEREGGSSCQRSVKTECLDSPLEEGLAFNRMIYLKIQQPRQKQRMWFLWVSEQKHLQSIRLFSDGWVFPFISFLFNMQKADLLQTMRICFSLSCHGRQRPGTSPWFLWWNHKRV